MLCCCVFMQIMKSVTSLLKVAILAIVSISLSLSQVYIYNNYFCILAAFDGFPEPELMDLMSVVGINIRSKWRAIGLGLGLGEPELNAIQENNKGGIDPTRDSMTHMFTRWHDGMTSEYSRKKLAEVLCSPLVNSGGLLKEMHSKLTEMYS